jgi:gamma-glutamyltranspeptidase/glutathione hydrolase
MPGIVTRAGDAWLAFGAIGGDLQPQAQRQILHALLDLGCDVWTAGAHP